MEINYSMIYSVCSLAENQKVEDLEAVLKKFNELQSAKNHKKAKAFLKEKYGIDGERKNYRLKSNANISVEETAEFFSVELAFEKEIVEYCFQKKKGVK